VDPPVPRLVTVEAVIYTQCGSTSSLWPDFILVLEAAALMYGIYLCVRTRNIPSVFNESKFIAFTVYNYAALGGLVIGLSKAGIASPAESQVIEVVGAFLLTSAAIGLMVVPKLWLIYGAAEAELNAVVSGGRGPQPSSPANRGTSTGSTGSPVQYNGSTAGNNGNGSGIGNGRTGTGGNSLEMTGRPLGHKHSSDAEVSCPTGSRVLAVVDALPVCVHPLSVLTVDRVLCAE
jgi:hypothetical protein